MYERVVITGLGAVCSLGLTVADIWQNVVNGNSGVGPITLFDTTDFNVHIACEVKNFQPMDYMSARVVRRRDRYQIFASVAAKEAVQHAGLGESKINLDRAGVIISSAIGGLNSLQEAVLTVKEKGPRRISPFAIPKLMSNGASGMVAIDTGFKGPAFSVASACASGSDALGVAWTLLRAGIIDVAIAGGSEAIINSVAVGAFDRLRAMARRDMDNSAAPQPFDRDRDGFVLGEGAGIMVLENESHARARGVSILAELAGHAATADAYHITAPAIDGAGGAQAMKLALDSARLNPEDVDYINAHGTATRLNDLAETIAIKTVFGDLAYNIPVSSTKSMTGHMMGATGALEAILCVQAVRENVVPPTINYQNPDPECDLDYVPNSARDKKIRVAMSNAFGFGGHNAAVVIRSNDQ